MADKTASFLYRLGRWSEANEIRRFHSTQVEMTLGKKYPDKFTSINNLAFTWRGQCRTIEVISLTEECSQPQKQVLGPGHPYTKASLETLHRWKDGGHEID